MERALEWYRVRGGSAVRAIDLCTGTGCIAISLYLGMRAIARPSGAGCRPILGAPPEAAAGADASMVVVATDVVPAAVELARGNAARLGAPIECRQGDLWSAVDPAERFDLIVSNPPYVDAGEMAALPQEYRHEPALGLAGGVDGNDLVRRLLSEVVRHLAPDGCFICEVGASAAALQASESWPFVWPTLPTGGEGVFLLTGSDMGLQSR